MLFCPHCANLVTIEHGDNGYRVFCSTCPYVHEIKKKISTKFFPKLKEVDDVLGGPDAWKNVDATDETCPECSHGRAYFMQMQIRSADEPMTTFYKCCNASCGYRWRDNN